MAILTIYNAIGVGFDMSGTDVNGGLFATDEQVSTGYIGDIDSDTSLFVVIGAPPITYALISGIVDPVTFDVTLTDMEFLDSSYGRLMLLLDMNLDLSVVDDFSTFSFPSILAGNDAINGNDFADIIKAGSGNDFVVGNGGADSIEGEAGADTLLGGAGGDTLSGGAGNDSLVGEAGTDVAVFSGLYAAHAFSRQGSIVVVTGPDGTDRLDGIEQLRFGNGQVVAVADLPRTSAAIAAPAPLAEGNAGTRAFAFTVTLAAADTVAHSLSWAVTGSGANPANAADFGGTLPSGTVGIAAGLTSATITVTVAGDALVEPDEGFTVTLSNPSAGLSIATASASATILNDDSAAPSIHDTLAGTASAETLNGLEGNDSVSGAGGDDLLTGGTGADTLLGGAGNDTLRGGAGVDRLEGGDGFDIADYGTDGPTGGISVNLLGFNPSDPVFALDGHGNFEVLVTIEGVFGTDFADVIYGTNDANLFRGAGGADQFVGWGGADSIEGGGGDDVMLGWTGNDSLLGEDGADYAWAGDGNDTALGGAGVDVLVGDLPGSAETGNDSLVGGLGEDVLLGGAGNDTLVGGADTTAASDAGARDWLIGGAGNDLAFGGAGDDVIWEQLDGAEGGNDTAQGGDGADLILLGAGVDSIDGGAGNDTIYGGAGADTIATGAGADLLWMTGSGDIGDVIADFTSGADRMAVYPLLGGALTTAQAFASGVLALVASGADTLLRHDSDGAGAGAAVTVATFLGRAPGGFNTAADFI